MAMNPRLLRPLALPRLLDFAPGAAAAYSLRQLSSSYAGPVVTVRRSTDNAEADFTASEVSDGTLAAWCGGGDGFVKTWHDQTLNNRDATQTTTGYQPKVVSSGVVVTEGAKPALSFDGTDDQFNAFSSSLSPSTVAAVAKCTTSAPFPGGRTIIGSSATNAPLAWFEDGRFEFVAYSQNMTGPIATNGTQNALAATNAGTTRTVTVNGGESVANTGNQTVSAALRIGSATGTQVFIGTMSELLIYDQVLPSALRDRITADQMWYF